MNYCENSSPIDKENYRKTYQPYQDEVKMEKEPRKDHNIVVEAKLVRLLKRSKTNLTIEMLSTESGYEESVVTLAMKRLENKGIADLEDS